MWTSGNEELSWAFRISFLRTSTPFPRAEVTRRWQDEIANLGTYAYVSTDDAGVVNRFAATRNAELLHFGTTVEAWGIGLAQTLHNAVVDALIRTAPTGTTRLTLRVFEANLRARRFYEKLGWFATGQTTRTSFPPRPLLLEYHHLMSP